MVIYSNVWYIYTNIKGDQILDVSRSNTQRSHGSGNGAGISTNIKGVFVDGIHVTINIAHMDPSWDMVNIFWFGA